MSHTQPLRAAMRAGESGKDQVACVESHPAHGRIARPDFLDISRPLLERLFPDGEPITQGGRWRCCT